MTAGTLAWLWIPIVVGAALAQTVRNAAQRKLTAQAGTMPATLVRFLYGLPFAALWVWVLYALPGTWAAPDALPVFHTVYFAWVLAGGVMQISATAFLLAAMKERNFVVAVAFSKTEILQVAIFSTVFLHEVPGWLTMSAILAATLGVVLLALPRGGVAGSSAAVRGTSARIAAYGLASGASFALSVVSFRAAALTMGNQPPWVTGAWGVMWAQAMQTLLLVGWLAWRSPKGLTAVFGAWRLSVVAGMMGAAASICWFTAFAMRPAADVRTLGLVEVLFSYLVSWRIFREKMAPAEMAGLLLVTGAIAVICLQL